MKKRIGFIAVALAAGCAVGLTGCAKGGTNVANLNSNWFSYTSTQIIQPTLLDENNREEITYDVIFTPQTNASLGYTVKYENGDYRTIFQAKKITAESEILSDYNREGFAEAAPNGVTAYYYKTEFSIDVTYAVGSVEEPPVKDSTVTECYFLSAGQKLRPLYSKQVIKSTSPNNNTVYKSIDVVYESFYKFDGSEVKTFTTDNKSKAENKTTEKTVHLSGAANTLFDEASFNIAVRAANLSAGANLSQAVSLYSAADGIGNFTLKGMDSPLTFDKDAEQNKTKLDELKGKLTDAGLFIPETTVPAEGGEPVEKPLSAVAVGVTYNGELEGVSQTYWFAAVENPYNNTGRATMLKLSIPLPFGLGKLDFNLKEIVSTFWN